MYKYKFLFVRKIEVLKTLIIEKWSISSLLQKLMAFLKSKFKLLQNEPPYDYIMGRVIIYTPKCSTPVPVLTYQLSGYFGAVEKQIMFSNDLHMIRLL